MKIHGKVSPSLVSELTGTLIIADNVVVVPNSVGLVVLATKLETLPFKKGDTVVLGYPVRAGTGVRPLGFYCEIFEVIGDDNEPQAVQVFVLPKFRVRFRQKLKHKDMLSAVVYTPLAEKSFTDRGVYTELLREAVETYLVSAPESASTKAMAKILEHTVGDEFPYKILSMLGRVDNHDRFDVLEMVHPKDIYEALLVMLPKATEHGAIKKEISQRVQKNMAIYQRTHYLQEHLVEIEKELEAQGVAISFGETAVDLKIFPPKIRQMYEREKKHLSRVPRSSPEYGMLHSYLRCISELPWQPVKTASVLSIQQATELLNSTHYGMDKVKEPILDYLAAYTINPAHAGAVLCFVGPPGLGKTTLAQTIAKALGRHFLTISLAGVSDEVEIKGIRRSYVGALPGKIIQSMRKLEKANPLILLDEIDKIASGAKRGDPAHALLEALDSGQNQQFTDTYLDVPFDLSQVVFIATANNINDIPWALRDRLEVIELTPYTLSDKLHIANEFLLPKLLASHALEGSEVTFAAPAMEELVLGYTYEAGVRELTRKLTRVVRKLIRNELITGDMPKNFKLHKHLEQEDLIRLLDPPLYRRDSDNLLLVAGMALGLAVDGTGGTVLSIEVRLTVGKGDVLLTGILGQSMQESVQIARSYARAYLQKRGVNDNFYQDKDLHLHIPAGATPKDGPSAGIAVLAALVSQALNQPTPRVALSGELTLGGRILPVGGIKSKLWAAALHKIPIVLLAEAHRDEVAAGQGELPSTLNTLFFSTADEVLDYLFPQ